MNSTPISQSSIERNIIVALDHVNKHFLCLICSEFVVNPRECQQCQRLFCLVCITKWLKQQSKVSSIKQKPVNFKCKNHLEVKNPHILIRNQISEIIYNHDFKEISPGNTIRCDFFRKIQTEDHLQQLFRQDRNQ